MPELSGAAAITPPWRRAPSTEYSGALAMLFISMPATSLFTSRKSTSWMAPPFTHSAPFSQFQAVSRWKRAGVGVDALHAPLSIGKYDWKNQIPNQPSECAVLLANTPRGVFWGQ